MIAIIHIYPEKKVIVYFYIIECQTLCNVFILNLKFIIRWKLILTILVFRSTCSNLLLKNMHN